ncbi:Ap4A phosphorylase-like protein II [Plenodomus tracheiphilus IPT5]|uniref:Ap4A phosphorylase-like protein II n=1 Tax=Plenodomus tracheiphilus IPT5 TaxID=1408161 RepID=A0A6A7BNJ4_9PLEO|nr:Ap4A phosphorylase-like protein II [Plenodomus tracheiphilus IPT5]
MLLGLSQGLPSLVEAKFIAAKASASLLFSPTEVAIIRTSAGIPFQLRYCPTLAKKPIPNQGDSTPQQKIDPFENPPAALHVADVPVTHPTHLLVLNKFPIIAEHFILATKPNKKQTHLLEQDDLEATYACLKAWRDESGSKQKRLFAFFNSGEHSGASQPHRHLQFLPLERMREKEKDAAGSWGLLVDEILSAPTADLQGGDDGLFQHPELPFVHFAHTFGSEPSGAQLLRTYTSLYSAAQAAIHGFIASDPERLASHSTEGGDSSFSYNLAMTTSGMVILPRRCEGTMLRHEDGNEAGFVALNGTALGGTMMVKHRVEWDLLRKRPELLDYILSQIGLPRESASPRPHV